MFTSQAKSTATERTTGGLVLWAQSTAKNYIRAKIKPQYTSPSYSAHKSSIKPQVLKTLRINSDTNLGKNEVEGSRKAKTA